MSQQTYIMLKPDCLKRGLMGEVISRIEKKGYRMVQAKLMTLDASIIAEHYAHLIDKPFYPRLEQFMLSGPVFGIVVEGEEVIQGMRAMMGPTNVFEAAPGTIRGDYATDVTYNLIHGSDSPETAKVEINRFFN
ncbi:nucleoside-diphosphate kinase [Globicatella sanguinis]|uniref:nucleoside-diphosphate kinase n=1 Tax=Globicatella sanguinis TaxID=13076 RepID=UPI002543B7BA|nr:nucleoside-diphosphate kinase [Globicatella sanguinis]MDK7630524.1 nucleoside-diphosphate kinase [Globicatella sanguinis]WIK67457.1 nucleoside-diphosphate kinase [Globicatella sanguinis]WKT56862.1 nucleoside-diphosphate kinase [Globicatella sanguinis]